jgi:hypothetical protein
MPQLFFCFISFYFLERSILKKKQEYDTSTSKGHSREYLEQFLADKLKATANIDDGDTYVSILDQFCE